MESKHSKMSSSGSPSSAKYHGSKGSSGSSCEEGSSREEAVQRSTSRYLRSPSKVENLPTPTPSPCKDGWVRVGRRGSNSSNSSPRSQPFDIRSNVDFPRLQLSPVGPQRRTSSSISSEDPYQKDVYEALR